MPRLCPLVAVGVLVTMVPGFAAGAKHDIKTAKAVPPKELAEPVRKLMRDDSVQLTDDKGTVLCELWFRKAIPARATAAQIKNGLTYRDLEESTVLGVVRFAQQFSDYRKQKVKPGVYTLRLGFQPMDGDHMGTAPYSEFCLLSSAKQDVKPDTMETKQLQEMSAKAIGGSHPGVLLLFPNDKPSDKPQLMEKENNHWVLMLREPVTVDAQKAAASLGIGLVVIGHTSAE